jgi:hypothetical protein
MKRRPKPFPLGRQLNNTSLVFAALLVVAFDARIAANSVSARHHFPVRFHPKSVTAMPLRKYLVSDPGFRLDTIRWGPRFPRFGGSLFLACVAAVFLPTGIAFLNARSTLPPAANLSRGQNFVRDGPASVAFSTPAVDSPKRSDDAPDGNGLDSRGDLLDGR